MAMKTDDLLRSRSTLFVQQSALLDVGDM